ncbi:MAG: hypothetical protein EBS29_04250, partial [Chloroflexia bacterium]|nr:hypothetical protein [Chloroflexia bacterium]
MILEQRYGAAQVVMRVTNALLLRAASGQATSPDTFRHEMFRTGWTFICEQRAVASLVNLVNAMLWALEDCETPQELQTAVQNVITTFRYQLNQRVLDTATYSLSLLSNCRHILTHGYSTTVHYALQHALRNGQRLSVTYVTPTDAGESFALRERIAAIGLDVDTIPLEQVPSQIHNYDAVIVGADTLDTRGLTNKRGTALLASSAFAHAVPFFTFCTSEKFLTNAFYQGPVSPWPFNDISMLMTSPDLIDRDITPLHEISGVITDRGSLPGPAIEAWLATAQLHPWLSGRG